MTDEQAKQFEENMRLVPFVLRRWFKAYRDIGDYDDVLQIGHIGLMRAVESYKPDKGFSFSTYAVKCIRNEILQSLRQARARPPTTSLDALMDEEGMTLLDILPAPGTDVDQLAYARERIQAISDAFDGEPILREVALKQMTQQEAAELLGISQAKVSRRLNAILKQHSKEEDNGQDQFDCHGDDP